MPRNCPRCCQVSPDDALFCWFDGAALDGPAPGAPPLALGMRPFPFPFVFMSGRSCSNFDELVLACEQEWDEAWELLKEGWIENFLRAAGFDELAAAARGCAGEADPSVGLDRLLDRFPGDARKPPRLAAHPCDFNLGQILPGTNRCFELRLKNDGMGLLTGWVVCGGADWLVIGDGPGVRQRVFQCHDEARLTVQVIGARLRAGRPDEGQLFVGSSGGPCCVPVRLETVIIPFAEGVLAGADSPKALAALAASAPREAAPLFENGGVAAWYESNGWTYPASPASGAPDAMRRFFDALGLTPPALEMEAAPFASLAIMTRPAQAPLPDAAAPAPCATAVSAVLASTGTADTAVAHLASSAPTGVPGRWLWALAGGLLTAALAAVGVAWSVVALKDAATRRARLARPAAAAQDDADSGSSRRPEGPEHAGQAGAAVQKLLRQLAEGDQAARLHAVQGLANLGPAAGPAIRPLLLALRNGDDAFRREALRALPRIGAPTQLDAMALADLVKDASFPGGRDYALDALANLGPDARPAALALSNLAADYSAVPAARRKAVRALAAIGVNAEVRAFVDYRALLRDPDPGVSQAAADALARTCPLTKEDLWDLERDLFDESAAVRRYALAALAQLGPEARVAAARLADLLAQDADPELRLAALAALSATAPHEPRSIEAFARALDDADPTLRAAAIQALAGVGAERGAFPGLLRALAHNDAAVRQAAIDALRSTRLTQAQVRALGDALKTGDAALRARILDVLEAVGPDVGAATAGLKAVLESGPSQLRPRAVELLARAGPAAKRAGPALAALLNDRDRYLRFRAAVALADVGADEAGEGVRMLTAALWVRSKNDSAATNMRDQARQALAVIGAPAVKALTAAAAGDFADRPGAPDSEANAWARLTVVRTLEEIGPAARAPETLQLLADLDRNDPAVEVKQAARRALDAIGRTNE